MDIEKDNHSPNYKDKSDNHPDLNMEPPYQTENYKEQAQPNPNGNCIKQSDEFEGIQITGSTSAFQLIIAKMKTKIF